MATIAEQLTSLANTKTAIKDAIVAKGVPVADTDPFSAYPTKIGQIEGGGGAPATKYGVSIDNLLGNVDEDGVLQKPTTPFVLDGKGIKDFGARTMYYKFYQNAAITSVSFPDLETISQNYTCTYAFYSCDNLTSTGLQNLKSISGDNACTNMYGWCARLTSPGLDSLESITGADACQQMFYTCTFTRADFPKLIEITDTNALGRNTSTGMFRNCTALTEIHFRADVQALIESLAGYSTKFGATNATIYFDL